MRDTRVLCLVAALAIVAGCTGQDRPAGAGKKSPTASPLPFTGGSVRSTPSPLPGTPTPKPNLAVTTCRVENSAMRLGAFVSSATETTLTLYVKHVRGPACILSGYGFVALFAEDGSEVKTTPVEETSPAPVEIRFSSGQQAVKRLRWSTKPAADEPQSGPCGTAAVVLSVRLNEGTVPTDLYTKSSSRPQGIGPVCNHGRLMHGAWQRA